MLKTIAVLFGIIMLVIGILGYFPEVAPDGMLFGTFHVNSIHNLIHIVTGVVALLCGLGGSHPSRIFFRVFGVIYGIVAILGFYYVNEPILGLVANNLADAYLHAVIAVIALWLGFCRCCGGAGSGTCSTNHPSGSGS